MSFLVARNLGFIIGPPMLNVFFLLVFRDLVNVERFRAGEGSSAQIADLVQSPGIQRLRMDVVDVIIEIGAFRELFFAVGARDFDAAVRRLVMLHPFLLSRKLFVAFRAFVHASGRSVHFLFVNPQFAVGREGVFPLAVRLEAAAIRIVYLL